EQEFMVDIDCLETFGRSKYVVYHMCAHYRRLFFEKMSDWRDECEWRYLLHTDDTEAKYVEYRSSLVGIVFGENTSVDVVDNAKSLTRGQGLHYISLVWRNSSPWYVF